MCLKTATSAAAQRLKPTTPSAPGADAFVNSIPSGRLRAFCASAHALGRVGLEDAAGARPLSPEAGTVVLGDGLTDGTATDKVKIRPLFKVQCQRGVSASPALGSSPAKLGGRQ